VYSQNKNLIISCIAQDRRDNTVTFLVEVESLSFPNEHEYSSYTSILILSMSWWPVTMICGLD